MKYKYFNIGEIFEFTRGKRLIKLNQIDGDIPYISSTKFNNGVNAYITPPKYMKEFSNCITIANSGSVGYAFYHDYTFVASDHVTVLWLKDHKLNKKIAMYMITLLEKIKDNYFFNREMSDKRIANDYIKLPIDENEKVNYSFIENYIDSLVTGVKWEINHNKSVEKKLEFDNWGYYNIIDLFPVIERGKVKQKKELNIGDCPVISSSVTEQGILGFYDVEPKYENCLTISLNGACGYCVYHNYKFNANADCGIMFCKYNLNKYTGIFLSIIINQIAVNYQYGRKLSKDRLKKEKILLPTKNGKPDFDYMEKYIKKLPYSNLL